MLDRAFIGGVLPNGGVRRTVQAGLNTCVARWPRLEIQRANCAGS